MPSAISMRCEMTWPSLSQRCAHGERLVIPGVQPSSATGDGSVGSPTGLGECQAVSETFHDRKLRAKARLHERS